MVNISLISYNGSKYNIRRVEKIQPVSKINVVNDRDNNSNNNSSNHSNFKEILEEEIQKQKRKNLTREE